MATMRDVARLAGVSIATVSAVINNKGVVSEALTQRVRGSMEALDYEPDHVARSLKVGRTNVIGMVVPDVTNPFFTEMMRGVEEAARRQGYSVILCDSSEDSSQEERHLRTLSLRRVDGLLLAQTVSDGGYPRAVRRRSPTVLVDSLPLGSTFLDGAPSGNGPDAVVIDNIGAAYEATRHLIDLGHRRIAIIAGSLKRSVGYERLEGYRRAMQEARLLVSDEYVARGDFQVEAGYRYGLQLMQLPSAPTAIFACNNRMTLGLIRALSELKVACPSQVSIVGFDDVDWATSFSPKLTCVAQPSYQMGKQATELLLRRIESPAKNGETPQRSLVILKAELRIRESTAPPPATP